MIKAKLTKKELDNYFKIINAMREKAIDEMDNIKENSINESGNLDSGARDSNYAYHMADVGTDSHEREKSYLLYSRENKFIKHLDEALERIKAGSYGICMECNEKIPHDRLIEVPHTKLCIKCKTTKLNLKF